MNICDAANLAKRLGDNISTVIKGKRQEIDIIIAAMLSKGHVLLEDIPGTGKTVLAKTIAKSIDGDFQRIQFTPDLLPSDITGIHVYNQKQEEFTLKKGAVFTNILLGDEINRATPRTQSALLECMEERQVTIDGITLPLDEPFLVIATENPIETAGTFPLPEAQLDRFLIMLSLGFASREAELDILRTVKFRHPLEDVKAIISADELVAAADAIENVHLSDEVMDYILSLGEATRSHGKVKLGMSIRGLIALKRMAQAYAAVRGRDFVTPDDVKSVLPYVAAHRLILREFGLAHSRTAAMNIINEILEKTPVPTEDVAGINR